MSSYELKLAGGSVVTWDGTTPEDAARRYVDAHRDATVVATRHYPRTGVFPLPSDGVRIGIEIIEPGSRSFGKRAVPS